MTTPKAHLALFLQDIRLQIGIFLDRKDLQQCILVSHEWHQGFVGFLWHRVVIGAGTDQQKPSPRALQKHAHHVQTLMFKNTFLCLEYLSVRGFSNLKSLTLVGRLWPSNINKGKDGNIDAIPTYGGHFALSLNTMQDTLSSFLSSMSNLSTLNLVHTQPAPSDDVWRGLQRSNKSLQSISWTGLYAGNDPSECSRVFWGTCSLMKIKCLNLRNIVLDSQAFDGLSFPSLRELKLRLQQRESIADELQLISQCPALVELSWHPGDWFSRFPSADIKALLLPSTNWPSLRSMDFGGADMKDQDIAATLNSMTDASQLRFRRSRFGQGAFMALRNHFSTLVQLNISHCLAVSSGMMQEVLSSCPLLESFCTGLILSKEIVEGKPWVCLGLKTLAISISIIGRGIPPSGKMELLPLGTKRGRDDENKSIETAIAFHNATVLDQLARLHQLKHLSLSVLDRKMTGYRKVNLRLSGGLDKLSALTNLQHLSVELAQAEVLEKVEIEWIVKHWKNLREFGGISNCNHKNAKPLLEILRSHGIKVM